MKKQDKTNVMRLLDAAKIDYHAHYYKADPTMTGEEIAAILGENPDQVFKTLVTRGKTGAYYVFVIPVAAELHLKKAAKAAGEKSVSMIKQKELLPLTGYVHGGCSPIGMKKAFPTWIHETARGQRVFVSAGRVGAQIDFEYDDLVRIAGCQPADLVTE